MALKNLAIVLLKQTSNDLPDIDSIFDEPHYNRRNFPSLCYLPIVACFAVLGFSSVGQAFAQVREEVPPAFVEEVPQQNLDYGTEGSSADESQSIPFIERVEDVGVDESGQPVTVYDTERQQPIVQQEFGLEQSNQLEQPDGLDPSSDGLRQIDENVEQPSPFIGVGPEDLLNEMRADGVITEELASDPALFPGFEEIDESLPPGQDPFGEGEIFGDSENQNIPVDEDMMSEDLASITPSQETSEDGAYSEFSDDRQLIPMTKARLRALDKITGNAEDVDVSVGETLAYLGMNLTVRACYQSPPEDLPPESVAFLEVLDNRTKDNGEAAEGDPRLFSGWMFASSPGLSAMEHGVYDVWVIRCIASSPVSE